MQQFEKDFLEILSRNIKRHLHDRDMTQLDLAKALGVATSTVSDWLNKKKSPRMDKVDAMCRIFNCRRSDLMSDREPDDDAPPVKIPVVGNVAAGIPISAIEEVLDYEEIPARMAKRGTFFGLRIKGDSMSPRIMDGDVVIVRQQPDVESGEVAIVKINGEEATCKRVLKQDNGITLVPFNPTYTPRSYNKKEIADFPIVIVGKVVELRGKF